MATDRRPTKTAHRADFSQLSGTEFERMVLAFAVKRWPWTSIDWFGQRGGDGGRDIRGVRPDDAGRPETVVIACANWTKLTAAKSESDLKKIRASMPSLPDHVLLVAGGTVSASVKTKISVAAAALGFPSIETWAGTEFEERLRHHAESVLRRFFDGEELPDDVEALRALDRISAQDEASSLALLRQVFDRPAFTTSIRNEGSLPAFRRALADSIETLNTGIHRTRDGTAIQRMPSRHAYGSALTREALATIVSAIVDLRTTFDNYQRRGLIKPCGCSRQDCANFRIDDRAAEDLDRRRTDLLADVDVLAPR